VEFSRIGNLRRFEELYIEYRDFTGKWMGFVKLKL